MELTGEARAVGTPETPRVHFSRPYETGIIFCRPPGVETPGYYQVSLRDALTFV
jgi:hypothetical protein